MAVSRAKGLLERHGKGCSGQPRGGCGRLHEGAVGAATVGRSGAREAAVGRRRGGIDAAAADSAWPLWYDAAMNALVNTRPLSGCVAQNFF